MAFDLASAQPLEEPKAKFDIATAGAVNAEQRSLPEQGVRAIERTGRAGLKGLYAMPGMIANVPAQLYNKVADFYDNMRAPRLQELVAGKQPGFRFADQTRFGEFLADRLGLAKPENAGERIAEDVAGGMVGAGGVVKAGEVASRSGNALVKRVGEVLKSSPGTQVASGATGSGAEGLVRETGGGPIAQGAAGVAGSFVPAIPAAAAEAVRRIYRGGEAGRQNMLGNIDAFEDAGAGTPTVGQATESRGNRAVESVLAKTPGGAGPMAAKAELETKGLGETVNNMATTLAGRTGAAPAGREIAGGIKDFTHEFRTKSGKLYDELDRFILPTTQVKVDNASATLKALTTATPGAESLSNQMINPKLASITEAMATDARNGYLPYGAVKDLRTRIGQMLGEPQLTTDIPRGELKKVYGALTKDMEAAATEAGPDAVLALKRANSFHRAGLKRIDDVLEPILNKGDPEHIFQAAISGTKEGATTISGVMKSLPSESKKVVAGTMLKRLGLATPGKQNELGEAFSTETFLTNWNKISPDAKRVLFAPLDPQMRSDLDQVAKVASNIREGSKVFANPSGSGQAVASNMTAGAFAISVLTGQWHAAAGIAGGVGGAWTQGKLMTNPAVVHWLTEATRAPMEQVPAQLNRLFQQSLYMRGDDRKETRAFVKAARTALQLGPEATQQSEEVKP